MYVCARIVAFSVDCPLSVLSMFHPPANYTRNADQNVTNPASTQHSVISSAQVALGIIKSLVAPNHGPLLSAPFACILPFASVAGVVSRSRSGALVEPLKGWFKLKARKVLPVPLWSYHWAFYRTMVGYILSGSSLVIIGVSCELLRSCDTNGKVHGRWHVTSPCDNERTIASWTNALRAYEGKSSELIPPGPGSRETVHTRPMSTPFFRFRP